MENTIDKIDIIIPNKSNISDLFKCLDSLIKNIDVKKYKLETIIVDDFSKKSERKDLLKKIKEYSSLNIFPIFLNKHYGFTKAINTGLKYSLGKKSKPKYIAFLHNDTIIYENWLENLIYQIENDHMTYGVGSVTLNELDGQCISKLYKSINEHIDINEYYDATENNISEMSQKIWEKDDKIEFTENNFKDKISLFSALFKINAFIEFGTFNENLLSSAKIENEFCQRLIKNGKKVTLNPNSFVSHKCRQLSLIENTNVKSFRNLIDATLYNMEISNSLNTDDANHKQYVIYTYVPEYEELPKIKEFDNNTDYVCFTNDERIYGNRGQTYPWKIYDVRKIISALEFPNLDEKIKQFFKINPHLFFKNYNISIWIDSKYINNIKGETQEYVRLIDPNNFMLTLESSKFDCSYKELISLWKKELITNESYDNIVQLYRWFRYPQNNGFADTNIIIRKHNDERCILSMNKIWNYIFKYKLSENLFFNLVLWLYKYDYSYIPNKLFYSKYIDMKVTK